MSEDEDSLLSTCNPSVGRTSQPLRLGARQAGAAELGKKLDLDGVQEASGGIYGASRDGHGFGEEGSQGAFLLPSISSAQVAGGCVPRSRGGDCR